MIVYHLQFLSRGRISCLGVTCLVYQPRSNLETTLEYSELNVLFFRDFKPFLMAASGSLVDVQPAGCRQAKSPTPVNGKRSLVLKLGEKVVALIASI